MTLDDKHCPGYADMADELTEKFPLSEPQIIGEQNQKDFISLFGALLRMRNLLSSFDEFKGMQILTERDFQNYLGRYQDLRDGEIKTTGTDIDKLMPPVSRFGGGDRAKKKQTVIDKLKAFFDRFFGIGGSVFKALEPITEIYPEREGRGLSMVAEGLDSYGQDKQEAFYERKE